MISNVEKKNEDDRILITTFPKSNEMDYILRIYFYIKIQANKYI